MAQPILPLELHQSIIDIIGDDVLYAELVFHSVRGSARGTLRACSLVCKAWHDSALRYTFHNARFFMVIGDRVLKRNAELFRLLEANPSIRRCIRRAQMYLEREVSPEDVEKVWNAISPVETLRLLLQFCPPDLPRPSLDGLHPILSSRHLRNLSIVSSHFPLRLLEDVPNLRCLTLDAVETVDIEHSHDGAWRASTLEKLVAARASRGLFDQIKALGDKNVGLFAFFDRLKYLDMDLNTEDLIPNGSWPVLLARWKCLENLVVRWSVSDSAKFLELCQKLPWESFQALRSLTYDIYYHAPLPTQLFNAEVDPSVLIFTGPSRLPQLEGLHVNYSNLTTLYETEELDLSLDAIYLHGLNRTIEDPNSFPSLRNFHTQVRCDVGIEGSLIHVLNGEKLVEGVVDRLPAIFHIGGRRERHGWITSLVTSVSFAMD